MKTKLISFIALIALMFSVLSCKNDKKEAQKEEKSDGSLHVIISAIVPKDDSFQIYWNEEGSDNFTAEKFVNIDIKGNEKPQDLDFKIPEQAMPKQLRFDLGSNKGQGTIKINSLKLKYYDKVFQCQAQDFWKYFGNNTSIDYDKKTATVKFITNLPEGFDPIFGGTSNIPVELEKLYKNK